MIPNAGHKPPVLGRLAASHDALSELEDLEGVTSGRLIAQQKGLPGIPASALASGYGHTYINASFSYWRPGGNRFNHEGVGVWYAAFSAETCLHEVAFHLTRALACAGGEYDNETVYVELLADIDCKLCDVRDVVPAPDYLNPDPAIGYPAGQALARLLRQSNAEGIVYPAVRHAGGTCVALFWPRLIQNFRQDGKWMLKWTGTPDPEIRRLR